MPTNVTAEYTAAEIAYQKASTTSEKIKSLQKMLQEVPKHKGTEKLRMEIKSKLAKLKERSEKERQKKGVSGISVKKEGAAQIVLVGSTNSGKSTFLNKMTRTKILVADYPFTTIKPEIGILDYDGVKLQIVEMPALFENFEESENGPAYLSIIRQADLIILFFNNADEKRMLDEELRKGEVSIPILIYNEQEDIKDLIWKKLDIIKVRTKMPGKKPDFPPVALKKGSFVKDIAKNVHKDFIQKFKFARIWGKSVKFDGSQVGLNHKLADDDIVELHLK